MKKVSANYDANIQKLAAITQNSRKKDPAVMIKVRRFFTKHC